MKLWLRQKQKFSWNIFQNWTEIAAKTKKRYCQRIKFQNCFEFAAKTENERLLEFFLKKGTNFRQRQKKNFFRNNFLMGMNLRLRHKKILSQIIL